MVRKKGKMGIKEFFRPTKWKIIVFVIFLVINLNAVFANLFNKCGGIFCVGMVNSVLLIIFSLPFVLWYFMKLGSELAFILLLILSIVYNYLLSSIIILIYNKLKKK